jgi:hypothetical protein
VVVGRLVSGAEPFRGSGPRVAGGAGCCVRWSGLIAAARGVGVATMTRQCGPAWGMLSAMSESHYLAGLALAGRRVVGGRWPSGGCPGWCRPGRWSR